jgi:two-component system, NarL family, nitrate/nitrite response regulator NarL
LSTAPQSELGSRVLVTDTVSLRCRLLADELQRREGYSTAAAASSKKLFRLLSAGGFDTVLLGMGSSEGDLQRIRLIRQIRGLHPELNIIVLLDTVERGAVVEIFRSGARGIFCRNDSFESLCKCIRCVRQGQVWASTTELRFLLEALVNEGRPVESAVMGVRSLSQREQQITRLVAEGYSNRQISQQLRLSEHTIKNYLFRVFEKLGVGTRVELTLYALKHAKPLPKEETKKPALFPGAGLPGKFPDLPTN